MSAVRDWYCRARTRSAARVASRTSAVSSPGRNRAARAACSVRGRGASSRCRRSGAVSTRWRIWAPTRVAGSARGLQCDPQDPDRLDDAVAGLGHHGGVPGQDGAGGGFGVDGVTLAAGPAQLPVGPVHLDHLDTGVLQDPLQAQPVGAGALDTDHGHGSLAGHPPQPCRAGRSGWWGRPWCPGACRWRRSRLRREHLRGCRHRHRRCVLGASCWIRPFRSFGWDARRPVGAPDRTDTVLGKAPIRSRTPTGKRHRGRGRPGPADHFQDIHRSQSD